MKIRINVNDKYDKLDLLNRVLIIPPKTCIAKIYHTKDSKNPIVYIILTPTKNLLNDLDDNYNKKCINKLGFNYINKYTIYNFLSMTLISTSLQENLNLKRMNNVNEEDIQQFLNFYSVQYKIPYITLMKIFNVMLTKLKDKGIILDYIMFQKTHRITDGLNEPRLMNMRHLNKKFNIKEQ